MGKIKNPDVRSQGVCPGLYQDFGGSVGFDAFIGGMFAAVRRFFLVVSFWGFDFGSLVLGLWFWVFGFGFLISFLGFSLWDFYCPSFGYGGLKTSALLYPPGSLHKASPFQ